MAFAANVNGSGTRAGIEGDSQLGDGWGGQRRPWPVSVAPDEALHGVVATREAVTLTQVLWMVVV